MKYSKIVGTGGYLPEKVLTNADLEKMVETSDEWITSRTGIKERHIAAEGETTCDLAEQAARLAIEAAVITICILLSMLVAYTTRLIRVTERMRSIIVVATMGLSLLGERLYHSATDENACKVALGSTGTPSASSGAGPRSAKEPAATEPGTGQPAAKKEERGFFDRIFGK